MMPTGFIARCCAALLILGLAACGGAPPKPVATKLEIFAAEDINPDLQGQASPMVVRFFQLRTEGEFNGAKYFPLYDKEKETLGPALISRDEFFLAPNAHVLQELPISPEARFFGVLAGYRDPVAQWRAIIPVPPKSIKRIVEEQRVTIRLNKSATAMTVK
jgi:type VI secretion system protein VasD